jgi:hypothetical protein
MGESTNHLTIKAMSQPPKPTAKANSSSEVFFASNQPIRRNRPPPDQRQPSLAPPRAIGTAASPRGCLWSRAEAQRLGEDRRDGPSCYPHSGGSRWSGIPGHGCIKEHRLAMVKTSKGRSPGSEREVESLPCDVLNRGRKEWCDEMPTCECCFKRMLC